jgi:hypothetical protein
LQKQKKNENASFADEYVQLSSFLQMNTAERRFSLRKADGTKLLSRKGQNVSS